MPIRPKVKGEIQTFRKYNADFAIGTDPLDIEFFCIRKGGRWHGRSGRECGEGLLHHYKAAMTLLWPEDEWHRWADLMLENILAHKMIGIAGPQNAAKTYGGSKYALTDYWAFPNETLHLVSSTDVRGLELRIWGTMKQLYNRARARYPHLEGVVLESLHTITTDLIDEQDPNKAARELKKGIICIPCLAGGKYIGLGKYVGIKQKRVRLSADEVQLMGGTFLDSTSNLAGNPDFKGMFYGNPIDPQDPLGLACEPKDGWNSVGEPTKTTVWKTKFEDGVCVNLVGTDSPNFDHPQVPKKRYWFLVGQSDIDRVAAFWGRDSQKYYEQVVGIFKTGLLSKRILTRQMCLDHHALDIAHWDSPHRIRLASLDAAWGGVGGDRCVYRTGEFGESAEGSKILKINRPVLVPVSIKLSKEPEDQIAEWCATRLKEDGVDIRRLFYDSTGRGTLGSAFARIFSSDTPVPVEFGGSASERPVRHDLFTTENDNKRHVKCHEYFYDFVSELWMVFRYAVECGQIRELDEETMLEGCRREYGKAGKNKTYVESKHDPKARERMGRSPDLMDSAVTLLEGARQLGFQIESAVKEQVEKDADEDYAAPEDQEYVDTIKSKMLAHA
jgi:hypothetical protein